MRTIVEVNDLEKSYGSAKVLSHCSLRIHEGEVYGLLGVNGAGKTTLMKMLLGLQRIDGGRISVLGREVDGSPEYLAEVGSLIENPVFYGHLNAVEILSMHLSYLGRKADIPEALRLVGLQNADRKPVSSYSLGMRQRLALARAIVHRPKLLVLDEPLNGLDPIAIAETRSLMRTLADRGCAVLLSSHIIEEVRHTADRIGILAGGCIRQELSRCPADGGGEGDDGVFMANDGSKVPAGHLEDYVVDYMRDGKKWFIESPFPLA